MVSMEDGEGGGMKDVIAVLNRILYLVLDPTRPAKILMLDENLKALDSWRAPSTFPIITKMARELGIQVVWITHSAPVIMPSTVNMAPRGAAARPAISDKG